MIKIFDEDSTMQLLNGRWGAYLCYKGDNYKLPKGTDAHKLDYADCVKIVGEQKPTNKKKKVQGKAKR